MSMFLQPKDLSNTIMERKGMTKHVVVLFGASGSGKDTIAGWLEKEKGFLQRKFARPMKEFVEKCYGLRPFTLDTPEGKAQLLPESDKTFGDLLVGAYHFWQQFDDAMTARMVARDIEELTISTPWNVVLSDVRKPCEAMMLRDMVWEFEGDENNPYIKLHIIVVGGRGVQLSSDWMQKECMNILQDCCWTIQYFDNSTTLEHLKKLVDNFIETELH